MKPPPRTCYDASEIYPNLWQGAIPPRGKFLASKGFDVLILATREHQDAGWYDNIEIVHAPSNDDDRPHRIHEFIPLWKETAKRVAGLVRAGKKVLVTCLAGHNRSGIIVAFALHELTGKNGFECVEHIRSRRDEFALNNLAFVEYLCENLK